MWGKVISRICDVCLATGLMSLAVTCVAKSVKTVKETFKPKEEKTNG